MPEASVADANVGAAESVTDTGPPDPAIVMDTDAGVTASERCDSTRLWWLGGGDELMAAAARVDVRGRLQRCKGAKSMVKNGDRNAFE